MSSACCVNRAADKANTASAAAAASGRVAGTAGDSEGDMKRMQ